MDAGRRDRTPAASNATGGDYIAGILIYETMGAVERNKGGQSTTITTSSGSELGAPPAVIGTTTTVSITSTDPSTVVTADEPVGYYKMNDGSVYQINCVSGETQQIG